MKRVTMSGEPTMKRVTMWDATRLSRFTPSLYERQLPQDRDDLLAQEGKRLTKWAQLACHASHILCASGRGFHGEMAFFAPMSLP